MIVKYLNRILNVRDNFTYANFKYQLHQAIKIAIRMTLKGIRTNTASRNFDHDLVISFTSMRPRLMNS